MQLDRNTITHGGIEWGAEIPAENGGKPLPWLKEDEEVYCNWGTGGSFAAEVRHVRGWELSNFKIRLPIGHEYYSRDVTTSPVAPVAPANTVTLAKMTKADAWEKSENYWQRYIDDEFATARDVVMAVYRELGLIAEPETDIQRFIRESDLSLDPEEITVAEAAIKWARENSA